MIMAEIILTDINSLIDLTEKWKIYSGIQT